MMRILLVVGLALGVVASSALAHTGPLVNGEPAWDEISILSVAAADTQHDETINNPMDSYKGWWWINLTNNTGVDWSGVKITTGAGDLVAIVQGNGLEDEWGFVGNSVVSNRPGTSISYAGSLGSRTYDNSAQGLLWSEANLAFASPLTGNGQKVGLKVYTDNSYYEGPYASSFTLTITPIQVPEPVSALLLGLGGLFLVRRR